MQDKLDCQHNFCGWSYLFKGTEGNDLWNLLSSSPKPSQEQSSHSSWVSHAKMDTLRTESFPLSLPCVSLSITLLPFPVPPPAYAIADLCGVPDFRLGRPHIVLACTFITGSAEARHPPLTSTLVLCLSDPQCTSSQRETLGPGTSRNRKNKFMTVTPCLNYISVSPDNAHIFLPLFHSLHSLKAPFQIGRTATGLVAEKNEEKGWVEVREWWRWERTKEIKVSVSTRFNFGIKGKAQMQSKE